MTNLVKTPRDSSPFTTYTEYAHALEIGEKLYPHHEPYFEINVTSTGECTLCAHGLLAAGLSPERMKERIFVLQRTAQEKKGILYDVHEFFISLSDWTDMWHPLLSNDITCPEKDCEEMWSIDDHIVHLYDMHLWSIEQIKEWMISLDQEKTWKEKEE